MKTLITLVVLGWPSCRVLDIAGPSGGTSDPNKVVQTCNLVPLPEPQLCL